MKIKKFSKKPTNIKSRVGAKPVICYPNERINDNLKILHEARKYIKQIDACIESKFIGNVGTSSYVISLGESMKKQIEETDSEDTAKEVLARLYNTTNCEP